MKTIGLTGGIATGKSRVGDLIRTRFSVAHIEADSIGHALLRAEHPVSQQVIAAFGPDILSASGEIERRILRQLIFHDKTKKETLEAIMHPAITQEIFVRLKGFAEAGYTHALVESALLVETGLYRALDELWVVTTDPAIQLRRVMARDGCSQEDAEAIIQNQMPLLEKETFAHRVIRNDRDETHLEHEVMRVCHEGLRM